MDLAKLNQLFQAGLDEDRQDFAKMRSSLLLIAGEHYNNKGSRFWERIRTSKDLSNETKLRLTKNHIGRICKRYSNTIVSSAPGMAIFPANSKELQDQKAAELNSAVWQNIREKNDWRSQINDWADDFIGIGEVWTKVFYDQSYGPIIGYEPQIQVDPISRQEVQIVDEAGNLLPDENKPIRQGLTKIEEVYAFNVLRDPRAKNIKKSSWYCVRKMVSTADLKAMFPGKEEEIKESKDETFMVFDVSSGYRENTSEEVMVREWFFRPTSEMPRGKWIIQISNAVLAEGELPEDNDGVIFPLVCERFENVQTKARGMALTEPLRPYQAEVNRTASKIAETQITLGDDKLLTVNGSKISAGAQLPGIRAISVSGAPPTVLPGRSGEQYVPYMEKQIEEMYAIAELDDDDLEGNLEPHTLLYRSAKQKKRFKRYVERFEIFLKSVCETCLRTAKYYMPEESVIQIVGKQEAVNVSEFKGSNANLIQIRVEPQSDDVETKLGRQLVFNHVLQYVGNQLESSDIGKLIKQMPYANVDESFSDMTIDYENATNDILAMDRGEIPQVSPMDNHEYCVRRATQRMKQSDFKLLDPQIQAIYQQYSDAHMQIINEQKEALNRAQAGMVPASGTLIGVDFFVQDPNNPERTRRARLPYDAVEWLVKKLEEQSGFMSQMAELPQEAAAQYQMGVEQAQGSQGEIIDPRLLH